eukprot:scaffold5814_cov123-Isochrysis_galbana.AAC.13
MRDECLLTTATKTGTIATYIQSLHTGAKCPPGSLRMAKTEFAGNGIGGMTKPLMRPSIRARTTNS